MDTVEAPPRPADLGDIAAEHWSEIVPRLVARRTLTVADVGHLVGMCEWWEEFVVAREQLRELRRTKAKYKGHLIDHPGPRMRSAWEQYSKAAQQFGLTPAAKSRVQAGDEAKPEGGKARFFGGPKLAAG